MSEHTTTFKLIEHIAHSRGWSVHRLEEHDPDPDYRLMKFGRPTILFRLSRLGFVLAGSVDGIPLRGRSGDLVVDIIDVMKDDPKVMARLKRRK